MSRCSRVFFIFCLSFVTFSYSQRNVRSVQDLPIVRQLQPSITWEYNALRHYLGGERVVIFEGNPFDILLSSSSDLDSDRVDFKLTIHDTFTFQLLRERNGLYRVENFKVVHYGFHNSTQDVMNAQGRITSVLNRVNQFRVEDEKRTLIFFRGNEQISFNKVSEEYYRQPNVVETRNIAPESYFRNGKKEQLFSGDPFDIFLDTEFLDKIIKVTLRGRNNYQFALSWDARDALVRDVHILDQPVQKFGTQEEKDSETKIRNIIANTKKVRIFKKDGPIEFIADDGNTSITFVVAPSRTAFVAPGTTVITTPPTTTPVTETRKLNPKTYYVNGNFAELYSGDAFDIFIDTVTIRGGHMKLILRGINNYEFEIFYNNADGWVESWSLVNQSLPIGGSSKQQETEEKIKNIIQNIKQIAFEKNGQIQLINSISRVSFDPINSTKTYQLLPNSYRKNGQLEVLYDPRTLSFTIQVFQPYTGYLRISLDAVNSLRFNIRFNAATGMVVNIEMESPTPIPSDSPAGVVESKVKGVILNAKYVTFIGGDHLLRLYGDSDDVMFERLN